VKPHSLLALARLCGWLASLLMRVKPHWLLALAILGGWLASLRARARAKLHSALVRMTKRQTKASAWEQEVRE
jgi:hypothetical protein